MGYIVNEILDYVHLAISRSEIVSVELSWIKYISDWTRSGPGIFAGIKVTKQGSWPHSVVKVASTR